MKTPSREAAMGSALSEPRNPWDVPRVQCTFIAGTKVLSSSQCMEKIMIKSFLCAAGVAGALLLATPAAAQGHHRNSDRHHGGISINVGGHGGSYRAPDRHRDYRTPAYRPNYGAPYGSYYGQGYGAPYGSYYGQGYSGSGYYGQSYNGRQHRRADREERRHHRRRHH